MDTREAGGVTFLTSPLIKAPHGFSTRLGGVSDGVYESLNLGLRRGDDPQRVRENYRRFCAAIGVDVGKLAMGDQVHGTDVPDAGADWAKGDLLAPSGRSCDGFTTRVPGLALTVFTADCVPILLYDPVRRAAGAVHAGWRGTVAGIAPQAVAAMVRRYGCRPGDIRAAIGPCIGPCCFETGEDVAQGVRETLGADAGGYMREKNGKYFVDLTGVNAALLTRAGVAPDHIDKANECTYCHPERYWSHRYTGGVRGSMAAMIAVPEGVEA